MGRLQSVVDVHVVFQNSHGERLFIKRANTGYKDGYYSLVAGHLEAGESIVECAIRESYEEAGVDIDASELSLRHVMRRDAEQNRISFFFECCKWKGTLKNMEPEKCSGFLWVQGNKAPQPTVEYVAYAIERMDSGEMLSDFNAA